jgi:hypothetical protein
MRAVLAISMILMSGTIAVPEESYTTLLDPLVPWDYDAMFTPATVALQKHYRAKQLSYRLLAWHVMENDRGLRVEGGLLWFSFRSDGIESWALADVYRHPHEGPAWQLSYVTDIEWVPLKVFLTKPTKRDVYAFGPLHWTFGEPPVSFRYLAAHVCDRAWLEAIGSPPEKHYPGEGPGAKRVP